MSSRLAHAASALVVTIAAAPIQIRLDVGHGQLHARWTAVDHAANGRAVGFTEVGDAEKGAEGVAAHGAGLSQTTTHAKTQRTRKAPTACARAAQARATAQGPPRRAGGVPLPESR